MRRLLAVALCSLSFAIVAHARARADKASARADLQPENLNAGDWSGIRGAHEAWKRRVVEAPEGLRARLVGQHWHASFDGRGVTLAPDDCEWTWGLELQRWGFDGALRAIERQAAGCAAGERVEYGWDAGLTEWYVNGALGLEHGYTVHRRPEGEGHLAFELAVRGDLGSQIDADGRGARFVDASDAAVLTYAGLAVYDATGRALDARLAAFAGGLRIEVDERGARYPLTIDPTVQQAYLKASNADATDWFGYSVAISGDTVVVGARFEDSNSTTIDMGQADNSAASAGAAYVFVRSGAVWSQQAYLKASNTAANDWFGDSVAISGDTVVVGALFEDSHSTTIDSGQADNSSSGAGAAYVFVRNAAVWSQQAYLKASNTGVNDQFGASVAVWGDTVVVGAYGEDSNSSTIGMGQTDNSADASGAAYVFVRDGVSWSQQAYLKASNTDAGDLFGWSVAISGDTAVVGAYGESSNSTTIGAGQADNSASSAGAAYVFVRNGVVWSQQAYLKASNTGAVDVFGQAVAVSGDTVLVGARFEDSNSITIGMGQTDNSAETAGAAYVFVRNGAVWSQQAYLKASNTAGADEFGRSVAVSGNIAVVGAFLEDSSSAAIDMGEGDNAATDAGAAYVFVRNGVVWSQQAFLKASNSGTNDFFGSAVSVWGDTVVVGANLEDSDSTTINMGQADNDAMDAGAVYVFVVGPPVPVPYCFGDGSGALCPCSPAPVPHGAPGKGCPTNVFPGGAQVSATGAARVTADTLVLHGTDVVNGSMLFFQGAVQQSGGAGAVFGDGKRCVEATGARRFRVKPVVGNVTSYPQAGDPAISTAGAIATPGIFNYQGWYRSANPTFCTSATFNLTNGLRVTWVP